MYNMDGSFLQSTPESDHPLANPFYSNPSFSMSSSLFPQQPTAVPKVTLTKFSGYTHEDGAKFLNEFISYCTFNSIFDDARKVAAFHLHLTGPALIWFNSLKSTDKQAWLSVHQHYVKQYANLDVFDPALVAEAEIFENLTLLPHQQIEDFHSNVLEKGTKLGKSQRDLISRFVNGLPGQLAFFVRARNISTLKDALTSAKLGEAYGYRGETVVSAVKRRPKPEATVPDDSYASLEKKIAELTERLSTMETHKQDSHTVKHLDRQRDTSAITCYKCSGSGHVERRCNWTGYGTSNPTKKCQICDQFGHIGKQCRRFRQYGHNRQTNSQGNAPSGPRNVRP